MVLRAGAGGGVGTAKGRGGSAVHDAQEGPAGDGAGGFSPDKPVNREQTAAFLYRMHNHLN